MIDSRYYVVFQAGGWLALYTLIVGSLYTSPAFSSLEFLFAFILLGVAGTFSHLMRAGFKSWAQKFPLWQQSIYFLLLSILGAATSALVLFGFVFLFSKIGIVDPIVPGQIKLVFSFVFWGNAINMLIGLVLWSAFYLIIIKARELRDTGEALASSQLEALVQQLKPHFLFNMMNNIRALILEDPEKARHALSQLADMLRYSLKQHENGEVTVREELTVVIEYIDLCKIQFEERLQFESQIPEALLAAKLPRMVLQLCVENAIKHGIGKRKEGGCVQIAMRELEGNWLEIFVTNPCPVQNEHKENDDIHSTSIGLRNIRERIKLLYKDAEVHFSLKDSSPSYAIAETYIVIPLNFNEH